ncbi:hypothetical protein REH77_13245, partial [Vibrio alginolyticus]
VYTYCIWLYHDLVRGLDTEKPFSVSCGEMVAAMLSTNSLRDEQMPTAIESTRNLRYGLCADIRV